MATHPTNQSAPSKNREALLAQAVDPDIYWDFIVIGGGATGAGIALDAATRGYTVLLLEGHDYGKGTSSRSTKLIHGGVRYLEQFQFHMVKESLLERGRLLQNAPHIVHELEFVIPCKNWFERVFYGIGLKLYDFLARGSKAKRSRQVSAKALYQRLPGLIAGRFAGGVSYSDAQFDDTRLLTETILGATQAGAVCLNYAPVVKLLNPDGERITGVEFVELETGRRLSAQSKVVINATGPFCDEVRRMDNSNQPPLVAASQGIHLVLPKTFFPSENALIVPKTSDGRVLFVIPWHQHILVGTTDTAIEKVSTEPRPYATELTFLLDTLEEYFGRRPRLEDCLSVFTGIRPLVKGNPSQATKKLSRDHTIEISNTRLLTITGGKWTTYRHMAEDCIDQAAESLGLKRLPCKTYDLRLQFSEATLRETEHQESNPSDWPLDSKSTLASVIRYSDLIRGVRCEQARTVEDLLARRTRALFLNAEEAIQLAPIAARILANELQKDSHWVEQQVADFSRLAEGYIPKNYKEPR